MAPAPMSVPAISQPPLSSSVDVLKVVVCPAFLFSGLEQESSKRLALAANATLTWQKKNDALASHLVPADYVVATVMKQMTLKSQLADGGEIHRFGVFKQFRFGDYSSNTASVSLIPGAASSDALNRIRCTFVLCCTQNFQSLSV